MKKEDLEKIKVINKLKGVYRQNSVGSRRESAAEHSWSCLLLADYFIDLYKIEVDKEMVFRILMYHDLHEIYSGDVPLNSTKRENSKEIEKRAAQNLKESLPKVLGEKYFKCFVEFEEGDSKEAKFARAIDALDPIIHEVDYREDWKGWSKEFLVKKKKKFFEEFPRLKKFFMDLIEHLDKEGYFD